jgi:hypothetical protein
MDQKHKNPIPRPVWYTYSKFNNISPTLLLPGQSRPHQTSPYYKCKACDGWRKACKQSLLYSFPHVWIYYWIICGLVCSYKSPIPPTTSHHITPHHTTPFRVLDYKCNSCDGDVGMTCRLPFVFFILNFCIWKCRLDKFRSQKHLQNPYSATTLKRHYYKCKACDDLCRVKM